MPSSQGNKILEEKYKLSLAILIPLQYKTSKAFADDYLPSSASYLGAC